ncbi:MAG: DUF1573 domain-containing protein [Planctomycetota bacterium]|jgi:hypothetical protein
MSIAAPVARRARPPRGPRVRGRSLPLVLVGLLVILALLGGGGWWWMATGRLPLAGASSHDFGTVSIEGDDVLLTHEFVLKNRRSEPLRITAVRPSCGCAGMDVPEEPIAPGETVRLVGRLALEMSGPRTASVALVFEGGEMQRLFMKAVGRKERGVRLEPSMLQLRPDEPSQVLVIARTLRASADESPAEPPVPELIAPSGVRAEWRGWSLMEEGDPASLRADGWRGRVAVEATGEPVGYGATLVVVLPGASGDGGDIRANCRISGVGGTGGGTGEVGPPLEFGG